MLTLPSLNLSDFLTFMKDIRIKTEKGAILPFICGSNEETRSWLTPQHPTDQNSRISDTIWKEPIKFSLFGYVTSKNWETFKQLINGSDAGKSKLIQSIAYNIFGGGPKGKPGALGVYEITCLGGIYKNMALTSFTRSETADVNSAYEVTLEFQEVIRIKASVSGITAEQALATKDISTQKTGTQTPKTAPYDSQLAGLTGVGA